MFSKLETESDREKMLKIIQDSIAHASDKLIKGKCLALISKGPGLDKQPSNEDELTASNKNEMSGKKSQGSENLTPGDIETPYLELAPQERSEREVKCSPPSDGQLDQQCKDLLNQYEIEDIEGYGEEEEEKFSTGD